MMNAARARAHEERATIHESARVVRLTPLTLRASKIEYEAQRAVSCLVAPRLGDEVFVALLPDRRAFVLAVLERPESGVELTVEGDCTVHASGAMHLAGREGMSLVSGRDLDVVAGRFSLRALASSLASDTLDLVAQTVSAELDRARVAARVVDGFFERVTQRAKRSLRIVEEADQVRADRIDYVAESSMTLNADNAVVTARQLVKVDGSQIQLG